MQKSIEEVKQTIAAGVERIPVQMHLVAGIASRIPAPIMMGIGIWVALYFSTHSSRRLTAWTGKSRSGIVKFVKRSKLMRALLRGHDALFGAVYIGTAMTVAIVMLLLPFAAQVPIGAILGVVLSTVGVVGSISLEMVCSTMDTDEFKAIEYSRPAQISRRMYLHGAMGIAVASIVLIMVNIRPAE